MKKSQIKIIDCFTPLIVYTLEFQENAQDDLYTVEKLTDDYTVLIAKAREEFTLDGVAFSDALFPIVAWIDEVILNSRNEQKKLWQKQLLQKKFFNISDAGDAFFDILKKLPDDSNEVRLLYLYCLMLGFRGKYYRVEDQQALDGIFEIQKACMHDDFLKAFPKIAFKYAYTQNPTPSKKKFKTSYRGFWIIVVLTLSIGLVLFLASQSYLNDLLGQLNIF